MLVQDILQVSTWTLAADYKVGYNAVVEEDDASVRSGKRGGRSYSLGQHPHADWYHVYTLWTGLSPDEQRAAANHVLHRDGDDCLLLHYLCLLPAAPSDVVMAVLRVTNDPSRPCGLGLQRACFAKQTSLGGRRRRSSAVLETFCTSSSASSRPLLHFYYWSP
jgi:hypothetical protein